MKRLFFTLLLIYTPLVLFSNDGVINLKNRSATITNIDKKEESNYTDSIIGINIYPKSVYIGELGRINSSDKFRGNVISTVNLLLENLKKNKKSNIIRDDYRFIFASRYSDLLNMFNNINSWNIGYPEIEENIAKLTVELYFRNKIYIGSLILENNDSWELVDMQLEEEDKKIFDPSSPAY